MPDLSEIYLGDNIANSIIKAYEGDVLVFERGGGTDPDVQALLDQAVTDGYTACSGVVLDALNDFVVALKALSLWDTMDIVYLPATNGDSDFATYNLKDPTTFNLTKVNSPTFTSLEGFTGGGTAYMPTGYSTLNNATNLTLNDASYGLYIRQSPTSNGSVMLATGGTPVRERIGVFEVSGNYRFSLSNTDSQFNQIAGGVGFYVNNRIDSANISTYLNGVLDDTDMATSTELIDEELALFTHNNGGAFQFFGNPQISFFYVGASVANQSGLYTAIQDYMTALGTQV